ncbi:unnamed protein product, partial [Ectocarpus sp. 12 AP-2014]
TLPSCPLRIIHTHVKIQTHSYVDILQPWPVRQDLLRCHFFFECACPRC